MASNMTFGLVSEPRRKPAKRSYRLFIYKTGGPTEELDIQAADLNDARVKAKVYLNRPGAFDIVINNAYKDQREWIAYGYLNFWETNGKKHLTWLGDDNKGSGSNRYIVDPKTGKLLKRIRSYDVRVTNAKMHGERVVIYATSLPELRKVLDKKYPDSSFRVFLITDNGLFDVRLPSSNAAKRVIQ